MIQRLVNKDRKQKKSFNKKKKKKLYKNFDKMSSKVFIKTVK